MAAQDGVVCGVFYTILSPLLFSSLCCFMVRGKETLERVFCRSAALFFFFWLTVLSGASLNSERSFVILLTYSFLLLWA